jgi:hypothetical protein
MLVAPQRRQCIDIRLTNELIANWRQHRFGRIYRGARAQETKTTCNQVIMSDALYLYVALSSRLLFYHIFLVNVYVFTQTIIACSSPSSRPFFLFKYETNENVSRCSTILT